MLHPAKRELRDQNQIVLRERKLVVEILLEIPECLTVESKHLRRVRLELRRLRLADIDERLRPGRRVSTPCGNGGGPGSTIVGRHPVGGPPRRPKRPPPLLKPGGE